MDTEVTETREELVSKLRILDAAQELADAVRTGYGLPPSAMINVTVVLPQGVKAAKQLWSRAFMNNYSTIADALRR